MRRSSVLPAAETKARPAQTEWRNAVIFTVIAGGGLGINQAILKGRSAVKQRNQRRVRSPPGWISSTRPLVPPFAPAAVDLAIAEVVTTPVAVPAGAEGALQAGVERPPWQPGAAGRQQPGGCGERAAELLLSVLGNAAVRSGDPQGIRGGRLCSIKSDNLLILLRFVNPSSSGAAAATHCLTTASETEQQNPAPCRRPPPLGAPTTMICSNKQAMKVLPTASHHHLHHRPFAVTCSGLAVEVRPVADAPTDLHNQGCCTWLTNGST